MGDCLCVSLCVLAIPSLISVSLMYLYVCCVVLCVVCCNVYVFGLGNCVHVFFNAMMMLLSFKKRSTWVLLVCVGSALFCLSCIASRKLLQRF